MDISEPLSRSQSLNNIPKKKLNDLIDKVNSSELDLKTRSLKIMALNRYADSNIPIEYWSLKMDEKFSGSKILIDKFNIYTKDIKDSYLNGSSFCLASGHGRGKTMTISCILKHAVLKNYTCLYTTLSDIVASLTIADNEDKFKARRELIMVDFLAIDEVDIRFFNQSDAANALFGNAFESIFRVRTQNKLPIIMATNSPNIKEENFQSLFKDSVSSLMNKIEIIPIFGQDFRKLNV